MNPGDERIFLACLITDWLDENALHFPAFGALPVDAFRSGDFNFCHLRMQLSELFPGHWILRGGL